MVFSPLFLFCQTVLKGQVLDQKFQPIASATIQVLEQKNSYAITDFEGNFELSNLKPRNYTLKINALGYTEKTVNFLINDSKHFLKIIVDHKIASLKEVVVTGKTKTDIIKEQAFEVEAVEIKALKNASVDINGVLATIPGVNIRQSGGLGSDFNFSLNGFSGNQVKFFIDGIPQDNLGSSLSLNNFPATLVERVEVYKGVVPVFLGADALGGAINVVTNQKQEDFLDISYDIGSFNTHRATLNNHKYTKKGFAFQLASFYNYSDNDYNISTIESGIEGIPIRDKFGNISDSRVNSVKRFHDAYESQMIQTKIGVVNKTIADDLFIGITASASDNEIQHNITPSRPFGEVTNKTKTQQTFFVYRKNFLKDNIKTKLYAELAQIQSKSIDTSSFVYNWFREKRKREIQFTLGELGIEKTLFEFSDNRKIINGSAKIKLNRSQSIDINYIKNYLKRKGNDEIRTITTPFETPHVLDKDFLGISYNLNMLQNKLQANLFGKGFRTNISGIIETFENREGNQEIKLNKIENKYNEYGFGLATSYRILRDLQIKGSYENTLRIPEGYEFFGDGLLLQSNLELNPEESKNLNLGVLFKRTGKNLRVKFDANLFKRNTRNYIFLTSTGILSRYNNVSTVDSWGIENEVTFNFFKNSSISTNVTYQNIEQSQGGRQFRLSNIPYLFGNIKLSKSFKDVLQKNTNLTLLWSSYFVEEFPLQSFEEGNPKDRLTVPKQLSHNVQLNYSLMKDKYNISFLIRNLTNESVFDNFLVQQPGRFFSIKFRYLLQDKN